MENKTRVSLQYGITIDELPSEIERLSAKVTNKYFDEFAKLIERANTCSDQDYLSNVYLDTISRMRHVAQSIDSVTSDIENIISGYLEMSQNNNTQQEVDAEELPVEGPPPVQYTTTESLPDSAVDLVEKMRLYRERQALVQDEQEPPQTTTE